MHSYTLLIEPLCLQDSETQVAAVKSQVAAAKGEITEMRQAASEAAQKLSDLMGILRATGPGGEL
jgi:hypothetical protein